MAELDSLALIRLLLPCSVQYYTTEGNTPAAHTATTLEGEHDVHCSPLVRHDLRPRSRGHEVAPRLGRRRRSVLRRRRAGAGAARAGIRPLAACAEPAPARPARLDPGAEPRAQRPHGARGGGRLRTAAAAPPQRLGRRLPRPLRRQPHRRRDLPARPDGRLPARRHGCHDGVDERTPPPHGGRDRVREPGGRRRDRRHLVPARGSSRSRDHVVRRRRRDRPRLRRRSRARDGARGRRAALAGGARRLGVARDRVPHRLPDGAEPRPADGAAVRSVTRRRRRDCALSDIRPAEDVGGSRFDAD